MPKQPDRRKLVKVGSKRSKRPRMRTSRMDIRLTPREHDMLRAKAKALRRTATSLVVELIEKLNAKG